MTNDYLKKTNVASEEQIKKFIDGIKKEDPVLGEKFNKYYDKTCDLDRISEDIVKYLLDADKLNGAFEKYRAAINPIIHKATETVKKIEVSSFADHLVHLV